MPRPEEKSEAELREYEIIDEVRAQINLVVAAYRRRLQNAAIPPLIDGFRLAVENGTVPAIDAAYRESIRQFVTSEARELGDGSA